MAVRVPGSILILLLVLCGLRKPFMDAIPVSLRRDHRHRHRFVHRHYRLKAVDSIAAVRIHVPCRWAISSSPTAIVAAISIIVAVVLTAVNLKGALLISIVAATIIGIPMGVTPPVTDFSFAPDFSAFAAPFQVTPEGTLAIAQVIVQPVLLLFVFSLLMSDFFDTMGTVVAVGTALASWTRKAMSKTCSLSSSWIRPRRQPAASSERAPSRSFVESVSGAAAGCPHRPVEHVIGIAFVACAFLAPVIGMVTSSATCGALVVVGYLMMTEIGEIDWSDIASAFPAFLTIVGIPMTYSIANGIGLASSPTASSRLPKASSAT